MTPCVSHVLIGLVASGVSAGLDQVLLEAEKPCASKGITIVKDTTASGGMCIRFPGRDDAFVRYEFDAPADGEYYLWCKIKLAEQTPRCQLFTRVKVNGVAMAGIPQLFLPQSSPENARRFRKAWCWERSNPCDLKRGRNTLFLPNPGTSKWLDVRARKRVLDRYVYFDALLLRRVRSPLPRLTYGDHFRYLIMPFVTVNGYYWPRISTRFWDIFGCTGLSAYDLHPCPTAGGYRPDGPKFSFKNHNYWCDTAKGHGVPMLSQFNEHSLRSRADDKLARLINMKANTGAYHTHYFSFASPAAMTYWRQFVRGCAEHDRKHYGKTVIGYVMPGEMYNMRGMRGKAYWDFRPEAIAAFKGYLRRKFGSVEKLNRAWDAQHTSFDKIEPLTCMRVQEVPKGKLGLWYEWLRYQRELFASYFRVTSEELKKVRPDVKLIGYNQDRAMGHCFRAWDPAVNGIDNELLGEILDWPGADGSWCDMGATGIVFVNEYRRTIAGGKPIAHPECGESIWPFIAQPVRPPWCYYELGRRLYFFCCLAQGAVWMQPNSGVSSPYYLPFEHPHAGCYWQHGFFPADGTNNPEELQQPALEIARSVRELYQYGELISHAEIGPRRVAILSPENAMIVEPGCWPVWEVKALFDALWTQAGYVPEFIGPRRLARDQARTDVPLFLDGANHMTPQTVGAVRRLWQQGGKLIGVGAPSLYDCWGKGGKHLALADVFHADYDGMLPLVSFTRKGKPTIEKLVMVEDLGPLNKGDKLPLVGREVVKLKALPGARVIARYSSGAPAIVGATGPNGARSLLIGMRLGTGLQAWRGQLAERARRFLLAVLEPLGARPAVVVEDDKGARLREVFASRSVYRRSGQPVNDLVFIINLDVSGEPAPRRAVVHLDTGDVGSVRQVYVSDQNLRTFYVPWKPGRGGRGLQFELPALKQTAWVAVVRDEAVLADLPVGSIKTVPEPRWVGRVEWQPGRRHPVEVTYRNTRGKPLEGVVKLITLDRRLGSWPTRLVSGQARWTLEPGKMGRWQFAVTPPADFRGGLVYASITAAGLKESHFSFLVEQPARDAPAKPASKGAAKREVYTLMKCLTIPDIDGKTAVDWSGQKGDIASRISFLLAPGDPKAPKGWGGPKDLSGSIRMRWGTEGLYLTADVTDDAVENHAQADILWNGDSIHLCVDTVHGPEDPSAPWNADCFQIMLSPTSSSGRPAMHLKGLMRNGELVNSAIACKKTPGGYTIEAFVSADNFRTWKPVPGRKMLMAVSVIDVDRGGPTRGWDWTARAPWTDRQAMNVAELVRYRGWHD